MECRKSAQVASLSLLLLSAASPARALVSCEVQGDTADGPVTLRIEILEPEDLATIVGTSGCRETVDLTGTFEVEGAVIPHDFYVVLDNSGSTRSDSGADVNGDGLLGGPEDTIRMAEIAAAQAFLRALPPGGAVRVALIHFGRTATLRHALSADLASLDASLEAMKTEGTGNQTRYIPALDAMEAELLLRGDPANRRQRGIFLSDGQPRESVAQIQPTAQRLAGLGLVIDTFALGFATAPELEDLALTTGGRFTALATPGEIVDLLPELVPQVSYSFDSANDGSGIPGMVDVGPDGGSFTAQVTLEEGFNDVTLTLVSDTDPPITLACTIVLELEPALLAEAGPDLQACPEEAVLLDGSLSTFGTCAARYRWLDPFGVELCAASDEPTCRIEACLPGDYLLETWCDGEPCLRTDTVAVACWAPPLPAPVLASSCGLSAELDCGGAQPGVSYTWDLDVAVDSDGNGDPTDDVDDAGCLVGLVASAPGTVTVTVRASDAATGCSASAELEVPLEELPAPRSVDGGACPGTDVSLACGAFEPGRVCWWDLDGAVDSDLNGDPRDDLDAAGCDVLVNFPDEGTRLVTALCREASGCLRVAAEGSLLVEAGAVPAEVDDLRVAREGEGLRIAWSASATAELYRVARGSLESPWLDFVLEHASDETTGQGSCRVPPGEDFRDPDDAVEPGDFYYLVVAANGCGGEGPIGFGWDGRGPVPRPARAPIPACP